MATPSMRPTPVAAGFQPCRPGSVSRAAKFGSSAIAKGVMLSAMPLAVADLTKSRREILIVPRLYWRNSFFNSVRWDLLATASLTIFGRGSTRPAALRNFNARGRRAAEQRDELAPFPLTEMHPIPQGREHIARISEAGPAR